MTDMKYTLSAASDLTQHTLQADILEADQQFEALHTQAGGAMLFFIGDGDVLCVAKEEAGREHGWSRSDLSSAQTRRDFPWGASCKRFSAVQGASGCIDLAMVLSDGSDDHLYLSLGNSDSDTAWCEDPSWLICPFNAEFSTPPSEMHIVNVLISEASDRYVIAVDIIANPNESIQRLRRYTLDLSTPQHPEWIPNRSGGSLAAAAHSSCLGRAGHPDAAEGMYTLGSFDGNRKLLYTPLFGLNGEAAAAPTSITLPGKLMADAMAACRNSDNTSDLYVAAKGSLVYFAGGAQHAGEGLALLESTLLENVRSLRAVVAGDKIVVWGLNAHGQAFYTSCPQNQVSRPGAWSRPLCTLAGVTGLSTFYDTLHGALVVLARTGNGLVKSVKSPVTGLWNRRSITLPPSNLLQAPLRMSSYVTCIRIADANGAAAAHVPVTLSASNVTSVYINGLYRIVGPVPISVLADAVGELTIIETIDGLAGARFEAKAGGCSVSVNPMDDAFKAAAAMVQDLGLARAYHALDRTVTITATAAPAAPAGFAHALHSDVGDLFSWLDSGIGGNVRIVPDLVTGEWHLVATIGGQVYHGALDCVEKIVAATLWLLGSVKTSGLVPEGVFHQPPPAAPQRPTLH